MGKMKEIYTGVIEIIEDIDNRFLKDKSAAYGIILTGALATKFKQKQGELSTKWLEEEVKND